VGLLSVILEFMRIPMAFVRIGLFVIFIFIAVEGGSVLCCAVLCCAVLRQRWCAPRLTGRADAELCAHGQSMINAVLPAMRAGSVSCPDAREQLSRLRRERGAL